MADDRSLIDIIRFADPSGEIGDAEISSISNSLKFSEVLDLISSVSKDDMDSARNILSKHDPRFSVATEYAGAQGAQTSGFKPIKPISASPTIAGTPTNPNGMQDAEQGDLEAMVTDPMNKNKPEVKQIQSLLQRLQNR